MNRLLLAVIGNDVHVVANRIIDQYFSSAGFTVANMGVACKPNEILDGIQEFAPNIVIISSLNGEATLWSQQLLDSINALYCNSSRPTEKPFLILGGNLYPRSSERTIEDSEAYFYGFGFDVVLDYRRPLSDLSKAVTALAKS